MMEKMKETAMYSTLKISKMYFIILTGLMNTTILKGKSRNLSLKRED